MFIRFDVIHERDGQTLRDSKVHACIASRGKNHIVFASPHAGNTPVLHSHVLSYCGLLVAACCAV